MGRHSGVGTAPTRRRIPVSGTTDRPGFTRPHFLRNCPGEEVICFAIARAKRSFASQLPGRRGHLLRNCPGCGDRGQAPTLGRRTPPGRARGLAPRPHSGPATGPAEGLGKAWKPRSQASKAARSPPGAPTLTPGKTTSVPGRGWPQPRKAYCHRERGPRTGLGTGLRPTIRERHRSHIRFEVLMRLISREQVFLCRLPGGKTNLAYPGESANGLKRLCVRQKNWSAKLITKPFEKRFKFDIGSRIE